MAKCKRQEQMPFSLGGRYIFLWGWFPLLELPGSEQICTRENAEWICNALNAAWKKEQKGRK